MLSLLSGERTDLLPVDRFCQVVQYRSLSGNIHFHIFIEYIKFRHIPDNAVQHRFFVSYQCIIFAEHPIRLKTGKVFRQFIRVTDRYKLPRICCGLIYISIRCDTGF